MSLRGPDACVHVDIPSRCVRFDEKDEEYRENVVKSFAALPPIPPHS